MDDLAPTQQSPAPAPVVLKNRYELREILGQGGMGRVHKGFDRVLNRMVAVKVLTDLDTPMMLERFEREAQTLSQLNHPHVAAVYDFGLEGTEPFMVMEYVEGHNLGKRIADKRLEDPTQALEIISQIADGLSAAHERGVIHRDLKPENILLCQRNGRDWIELLDFGLALSVTQRNSGDRLTMPGYVVGTARYMAPEQMEGQPATVASDLYSLGLVCAEILEGPDAVTSGRLRSSFAPSAKNRRLWPVIERACHEDPAQRWPSARAMADAFRERVSATLPATPSGSKDLSRIRRRKRRAISLGTAALMLCFGIIFLLLWKDFRSPTTAIFPTITLSRLQVQWNSRNELQVSLRGIVTMDRPQRLLVEITVCDPTGTRIPSSDSSLVDHALGELQVLDITRPPQAFDKTAELRVPAAIPTGYVSVTFFDANQRLIAQQNSGFWPQRPSKSHAGHGKFREADSRASPGF